MSKLQEQFEKETGFPAYGRGHDCKMYTDVYVEWIEQRLEDGQVDAIVIRTEVRKDDNGDVDEVLLYVNDRCVFHLETMSEQAIWFAMYPEKDVDEYFWINSKNGRSHIQIKEN